MYELAVRVQNGLRALMISQGIGSDTGEMHSSPCISIVECGFGTGDSLRLYNLWQIER